MKKFFIIFIFAFSNFVFATIIYNPTEPNVEQEINFTVAHPDGVYPPSVFWNFGDGTNAQGVVNTTKIYQTSGIFIVSVTYDTYKAQNLSENITINIFERRRISFIPPNPTIATEITFRAENFLSNQILWDFGDGTEPQCLQTIAIHRYTIPGRFTVSAWDWCGNSVSNITTTINVSEERGPRAPFKISFIQLRFEDGKSYKNVIKNSKNLIAYADIKYEGTGLLIAQWEVDGVLFKQINKVLPYANYTTINSGNIPSLPTEILGIHNITLKIIQPQVEYPIPTIRYFVSLGKYEVEKIEFQKIEVKTLGGGNC